MKRDLIQLTSLLIIIVLVPACATKKYTRSQVSESEARLAERLDGVDSTVEGNQDLIMEQDERLGEQEARLGEVSKTALEALDRAIAAGQLAEGRLVYERLLSGEDVQFPVNGAELSAAAREALDAFANELVAQNKGVFVEIQGHTDSTGSESGNMALGQRRAESVRRYLNSQHGFPLHRAAVISYGESEPIADNATREGRQKNRRVALVVLE